MQKMEKGNELKHFQERGLREEKRNNMLINVKTNNKAITLIAFAISRKCVRYEERAWKPCERREKERKV